MKMFNRIMAIAGLMLILASCTTGRADFSKRKYLNLERIKSVDEEPSAFNETPTPDENPTLAADEVITAITPEADPEPLIGTFGHSVAAEIMDEPAAINEDENGDDYFIPATDEAYEPGTVASDLPDVTSGDKKTRTDKDIQRWFNRQMWTFLLGVTTFVLMLTGIGDALLIVLAVLAFLLFLASFIYGLMHTNAMKKIPADNRSDIQKVNLIFSNLFLALSCLIVCLLGGTLGVVLWIYLVWSWY